MTARRLPFHFAWLIAGLTFVVMIVVSGIRSASGVLMVPLEHDMHWTAAQISVAIAINVTLFGLLGPFAAGFMESRGIKLTMLISLGVLAVATAVSSLVMTPLQLALTWGVGVGIGTGIVGMVLSAVIATRWFVTRRGFVYGLLTGASAAGQLVFLPMLAYIAQSLGWRAVGFACAAAAVLVAIPVVLFMRDRPEDVGTRALGAPLEAPLSTHHHGRNPFANTFAVLGRASHSRDFWLVAGTFFVCGATTNGFVGTHFMAICGDAGITQVHAAGYLGAIGVGSLIGSTLSGLLSDRFESRYLLFTYYGLRGLAVFALPFGLAGDASAYMLPIFVVFYGLDWLATGAPNVRALTEALGPEDAPIAFGWIGVAHQVGAGASALLAGILRTNTGSYFTTFELNGSILIVAALASLAIGTGRHTVLNVRLRTASGKA